MSDKTSGKREDLLAGGSRHHQIFPKLNDAQFAVLERYGERRKLSAGDVLFTEGDRNVPMHAIVSGTIEEPRGGAAPSGKASVISPTANASQNGPAGIATPMRFNIKWSCTALQPR